MAVLTYNGSCRLCNWLSLRCLMPSILQDFHPVPWYYLMHEYIICYFPYFHVSNTALSFSIDIILTLSFYDGNPNTQEDGVHINTGPRVLH